MNENKKNIPIILILLNLLLFIAIILVFKEGKNAEKIQGGKEQSEIKQAEEGLKEKVKKEAKIEEVSNEQEGEREQKDVSLGKKNNHDTKLKDDSKNTNDDDEDSKESESPQFRVVPYLIICRDEAGNILDKKTEMGEIGETVSTEAASRNGYKVDNDVKSIVLSENESENVIMFYYEEDTTVAYRVQCIDEDGDLLEESTDYGEKGSTIKINALKVNGYIPIEEVRSITLSSDEEDNVVVFEYRKEDDNYWMDIPDHNTCLYKSHTYFAYRTNSIDTFWEAEAYAESRGGHLAIINDSAENQTLYEYVMDDLGYESAYFGLADVDFEGLWEWVDGSGINYENWAPGQPDREGVENYALFWHKDPRYTWNNADFGKDNVGTVTFLIEWDGQ